MFVSDSLLLTRNIRIHKRQIQKLYVDMFIIIIIKIIIIIIIISLSIMYISRISFTDCRLFIL